MTPTNQEIILEMFSTQEKCNKRIQELKDTGYCVQHHDLSEMGRDMTEYAFVARPIRFKKMSWPRIDYYAFKLID